MCLCIHLDIYLVCESVRAKEEGNFQESVLSLHHVGTRNWT